MKLFKLIIRLQQMFNNKTVFVLLIGLFVNLSAFNSQPDPELTESIKRGQGLYNGYCTGCHKEDGTGYPNHRLKTPPLAESDYLLENKSNGMEALVFGLSGEITVNGELYNRSMPAVDWTDKEISDVLNYVRNSWGNEAEYISEEEIKETRLQKKEDSKDQNY